MSDHPFIIGTRGSDLALWQANYVKEQLKEIGINTELKIIKTSGDKDRSSPFKSMAGQGFFTKTIEQELLNGTIDIAVHSHKDLETTPTKGLKIAAVSSRGDCRDILIINKNSVDHKNPLSITNNAVLGTSSPRRRAQVRFLREDITLEELRGNVPTRLEKLYNGQYDAIILAKAGIERLNIDISQFVSFSLDPLEFIPAPAQGALAIQIKEDDKELEKIVKQLNNKEAEKMINVERTALNLLRGGCQLPFGAYSFIENDKIECRAVLDDPDSEELKRIHFSFNKNSSEKDMARKLVDTLRDKTDKSVFISKEYNSENLFFKRMKNIGIETSGFSLIETKTVNPETIPQTDRVFFTSPNAIKHFLEIADNTHKNIPFDVMGKGTKETLNDYGYEAEFSGEGLKTSEISNRYKAFLQKQDSKSILFPISDISKRRFQKELKEDLTIYEIVVYKTETKSDITIPDCDVYVLTSPSNVDSLFKNSQIDLKQKQFIAIGETTAKRLKKFNIKELKTAYRPDMMSLADEVTAVQ
ncbi:MAG: hydroxymethylbilane synthase [Flavobacteriales bacterium]